MGIKLTFYGNCLKYAWDKAISNAAAWGQFFGAVILCVLIKITGVQLNIDDPIYESIFIACASFLLLWGAVFIFLFFAAQSILYATLNDRLSTEILGLNDQLREVAQRLGGEIIALEEKLKPTLEVSFEDSADCVSHAPVVDTYTVHVRVKNVKTVNATGVLGHLLHIYRKLPIDEDFKQTKYADTLILGWAASGPTAYLPKVLHPNTNQYLDVFQVNKTSNQIIPIVDANLQSHMGIFAEPGVYRLVIQISGENVGIPLLIELEVVWDGGKPYGQPFLRPTVIQRKL